MAAIDESWPAWRFSGANRQLGNEGTRLRIVAPPRENAPPPFRPTRKCELAGRWIILVAL
jgi:hypothetical protein